MVAYRLARAGYWSGDPERVLKARVDLVLEAVEYENFMNDYSETEYEINKEG